MMRIEISFQDQTSTFYLVNKNAPVHETFEALRAFATSTFKNLPEDLVFSYACDAGMFFIADPQGLKVALKKAKKHSSMAISIMENEDSDTESFEMVTTTLGVASASEESEEEQTETMVPEKEALDIKDTQEKTEELQDKVPKKEEENEEPLSFRDRALQFVTEVGTETLQSVLVIAHSLLQNEGTTLQDAIHSALATCDLVKNKFVQDILPCINQLLPKVEAYTPMIKALNIEHWVAMVPTLVSLIQEKAEGNNPCELDIRPMMAMMCPGMIQHLEAMIPPGQERVFQVDPNNLTSVLQQAESEIAREEPDRVRHRGITCDVCDMSPIVGPRYKCAVRSDYDLCQSCHEKSDSKYAMIKIRQPTRVSNEGPFLGLREFARECRRHHSPGCGADNGNWRQFVPPFAQQFMPPHHNAQQSENCGPHQNSQRPGNCGFQPQQFVPPAFQGFVPAGCPMFAQQNNGEEQAQRRRPCRFRRGGRGGRRRCHGRVSGEKRCQKRCPEQSNIERQSTDVQSAQPKVEEKKTELKEKKKAIFEQKSKIQALKREAKKCRKELKMMKKQEKKEKVVFKADVVDHLDINEKSVQNGGHVVLKTWKVKNTGNSAWGDQVSVEFVKGDQALLVPGYEVLRVDNTNPGDVAYVRTMLNVPSVAGRYVVVYRLKNSDGKKFGQKLRTIVIVEEPEEDDSDVGVVNDFDEGADKNVFEDTESVASAVESVPESKVVELEPVKDDFQFAAELSTLKSMGFDDVDMLKAVLVSVDGDVGRALNALLS